MLLTVSGFLGSGKTYLITLMLRLLYLIEKEEGLEPYSYKTNYKTSFTELINPIELLNFELEKTELGLDEIQTIVNARDNPQTNLLWDYFFQQSRKRDVDILASAQLGSNVDYVFIYLSDYHIIASKLSDKFRYSIYEKGVYLDYFDIKIKEAKELETFELYDTKEVVLPIRFFGGRTINFDEIIEFYEESPNQEDFVNQVKSKYIFLSITILKSVYSLIKNDKVDRAKKLLRREL